jgi:SAM-dependent methyltransferase
MAPFDFLARHYNAMTGFPARIDTLAAAIAPWVERHRIRSALDAGCGGGALMFALRRCGVEPVGLDISEPMLQLAIDNARQWEERFEFVNAPFSDAGRIFPDRFDAVFAMGNGLVGQETDMAMTESLRGLLAALRPGGHLLLQILNLRPFFAGSKTLIAQRHVGPMRYWRYAVPLNGRLIFTAVAAGPGDQLALTTSTWENWDRERMLARLAEVGFLEPQVFGDLARTGFDESASTDLVIAATRPDV